MQKIKPCLVSSLVAVNWEAKRLQAIARTLQDQKWWLKADMALEDVKELYALKTRAIKFLLATGEVNYA